MSISSNPSDKDTPAPSPLRAANDPLVSCPIVCGEYMRATGFFFRVGSQTSLVTARHNLVPTTVTIANPQTGGTLVEYSTTGNHPNIDVYLRSREGWICEQIDSIAALDTGLDQQFNLDVVAFRIEFDPEEYGYRIWTPKCLSDPEEEDDELMIVGFDGASFPSKDELYSVDAYRQSIGTPRLVPFENSTKHTQNFEVPLVGIGLDLQAAGAYGGLSGAPVIGDGLVGIYTHDAVLPDEALIRLGEPHVRRLGYFRSDVLNQLSTPLAQDKGESQKGVLRRFGHPRTS